jgi:hypothetical protein
VSVAADTYRWKSTVAVPPVGREPAGVTLARGRETIDSPVPDFDVDGFARAPPAVGDDVVGHTQCGQMTDK